MIKGILGAATVLALGFSAPCCCTSLGGVLGLAALAFWIWAIVDVATHEPAHEPNKIIWLLVVILLHALGALIYFIVRRPERIRQYGK